MRVKKGQLRRWKSDITWSSQVFMTLSSRVTRDRGPRRDLGWAERLRGEILWSILMDGNIIEDVPQTEIHSDSEVIG
jgi:hypothetical protein